LEVGFRHKAYWCVRDIDSPVLWRSMELYALAVILVLPAAVMSYCYGRIIVEIRR